jgi:hypothetical protein
MNTELLKPGSANMAPAREAAVTPMDILQMAVSQDTPDIEKLTKLMELQERWEANEARKAFVAAMADFKRSSIRIVKDKDNKQYQSKYVSLGNLVNTVTPFLSDHGLSIRWDIDQSISIRVSCIVTHAMGHSESVSMVCPPDKSGSKNPIQEIKSAITYAKACTFESICGLASTDSNLDDDGGNSTLASNAMDTGEYDRYIGLIESAVNVEVLKSIYMAACKDAKDVGDTNAVKGFALVKDKRYREVTK